MNLTIIGGGSLGHVCAAVAASQGIQVNILTGHPDLWHTSVSATDPAGKTFSGNLHSVSSSPADIIPSSDIILLCLPGFLIHDTLLSIRPFLRPSSAVGSIVSSTGFFFQAHDILPPSTPLFGFQRVPYIARVNEYGKSAFLLGYKNQLAIAVQNHPSPETLRLFVQNTFLTPTSLLQSFYEAALTNSNPILHTARLYSLWGHWDGSPFDHHILFYKEWDTPSAQTLIDMDSEFMQLLSLLPVRKGAIPSLLQYYESSDAVSLAAKIRSIPAFQSITAPMTKSTLGWLPDFSSRYFTEDFPFGLKYIKDIALWHQLPTPSIDTVLSWGLSVLTQRR